jgi:hypothetical protein
LAILAVAPALEIWTAPGLMLAAVLAVVVVWPAAALSLWWMRRLMAHDPKRSAVGMIATALLRMTVAFGGGCLAFFGLNWEPTAGLALWLLIAVAYLSTLAAEVFVLAKPGWVGRGGVGRKG